MKNPKKSSKPFFFRLIRYFSLFIVFPSLIIPQQMPPAHTIKIGIQAGHWKQTDGRIGGTSVCDGTTEWSLNLEVAEKVVEILIDMGYTQSVVVSAEGAINNWTIDGYPTDYFDMFVSIHLDNVPRCDQEPIQPGAPSGYKVAGPSSVLVDSLWTEYEIATGLPRDPGHITNDMIYYYAFNYLSQNTQKAIIELAWLSNESELNFAKSEIGQQKMAQGIANGIVNAISPSLRNQLTATMLVIDVSGSMNDYMQGGTKIDAARSAATNIVNMIKQDAQSSAGSVSHRAGLVTFTTDAYLDQALSSDFDLLLATIAGITARDKTNIGAGLEVANQALTQVSPQEQKIIILLSDGMSNTGLSRDGILAGPVQDAINAGTCIYTVGFGDPGNLDEDLLRRIADASGCGQYFPAENVSELENVYIRIRHVSTGSLLAEFSGAISQGEMVQAGEFDVPAGLGELATSLAWPGSTLDLQLIDPSGTLVDMNYPGTTINSYSKLIYALIQNPKAGIWRLGVHGRDIPQGSTTFNALVSGRGNAIVVPSPTFSTGPVIVLVMLAIAGGGVAVYSARLRRRNKGSIHPHRQTVGGVHQLVFSQGVLAGGSIAIPESGLIIGRSSSCSLKIPDPAVSRQHARLVMANGEWFIQDLGSSGGTIVNGQRITAAPVKPGDMIQIGTNIFVFR